MTDRVFLDSGIFVALLNRRDTWHDAARALFSGETPKWFTSILVASETYSWFLHRMGEEQARSFRLLLRQLPGLKVLDAKQVDDERVQEVLNRFRGTKLTYVDASSLYYMKQNKIQRAWATDHHLAIAGAEILPRI